MALLDRLSFSTPGRRNQHCAQDRCQRIRFITCCILTNNLLLKAFIHSLFIVFLKILKWVFLIYSWFYKNYSRERSEQVLRKEGKEGCFLVRESSTPGMFTLSLSTSERYV
jgi:hypothetical protein